MPCRDYQSDYEESKQKKRLDKLTALLCQACDILEKNNLIKDKKLQSWWSHHKAEDAAEQEQIKKENLNKILKKQALKRLTPEEKDALGLK